MEPPSELVGTGAEVIRKTVASAPSHSRAIHTEEEEI
jgi:hypothetical protein